ncbi:MAG: hypothetical protein NT004_14470 [Bacteroidetes bacterium]|nr:hypothetical protein [Bacteroidota bacterium]
MISASYITADIANSTKLFSSEEMELLAEDIGQILTVGKCIFTFSRFDSFQAFHRDPLNSLEMVMQIRSAVRKFSPKKPDIRICLGLGQANPDVSDFTFLKDDLFVNTGREFDKMANNRQWFIIKLTETDDLYRQPGFTSLGIFLDFLFRRLTYKQSQVLSDLLKGCPQTEIAKLQNKSLPTINKQVKALSWENFKIISKLYKELMQNQSANAL